MTRPPDADRPRTEDDLRAAFQLAADSAPDPVAVLDGVLAATRRPARAATRRYLVPALAALVIVGVGIGVPLALHSSTSHPSFTAASGGSGRAAAGTVPSAATPAPAQAYGDQQGVAAAAGPAGSAAGSAGSAAGTATTNGPLSSQLSTASAVCSPSQLRLTVAWTTDGTGLDGVVTAVNTSGHACNLLVRPTVVPHASSGAALTGIRQLSSTLEPVGPTMLAAGHTATADVTWSQWCGEPIGDRADVSWGTGSVTVPMTVTDTEPVPTCQIVTSDQVISPDFFGPLSN